MFSKIITHYDYSRKKSLQTLIYYKILKNIIFTKNKIAKFQINDCFENFTHEPIVFAHYFEKSTSYLYYIKIYEKSIYYFTPFSRNYARIGHFFLFKNIYLNSVEVKFHLHNYSSIKSRWTYTIRSFMFLSDH